MNEKIISEFIKLINFVNYKLDKFKEDKDLDNIKIYTFKIRQLRNILYIIKKYPYEFKLETFTKDFKIPGMGEKSINRIIEIIKYGKLSELKDFKYIYKKDKIINELEKIVSIGRSTALDFFKKGIISIKDLKKKIKLNKIKVSDKIKIGIKYYGKFFGNIPRIEITNFKKDLKKIFKKINKKYDNNNKFIFEICGSYRRKLSYSGDIDILISKLNTNDENINNYNLYEIIDILKKKVILNDITNKKYKTKYMGLIKLNEFRRIDIRFVSYNNYFSSLLYFTGSANFNKRIRNIAKKEGYKLSEYGLTNLENNKKILINSEKDIFKFLNLKYLKPKERLI